MNVTIKTEILVKAWREFSFPHISCLSLLVPNEGEHPFFSLSHDHQRVILSEYEKVLGSLPAFRGWMAELLKHQVLSQRSGKLDSKHQSQLAKLGCDPEKQVFAAVAFNSDKILVTEDSAFGKGPKGKQSPHNDALKYLTDTMGMSVLEAKEARKYLDELRLKQQLKELDQERVLEVLAQNPEMVTLLEPDIRGNILGLQFERVVRDYLQRLGYVAEQGIYIDGFDDDIDVYAQRDNEILICECQMRLNPKKQPIEAHKVRQIIDRLEFLRPIKAGYTIKAWVASTSDWLEDDVNQWDTIESYGGTIQVMHFPLRGRVLRRIGEQNVVALLREVWFEDSEVKQITRP